ncbi:MAG: M1 family metallopeptidase [bacterium]|nr:M1 family metallopeptidase [bacterium]
MRQIVGSGMALVVLSLCAINAGAAVPLIYELDAAVDPDAGRLTVTGHVLIQPHLVDQGQLTFLLHETFGISSLSIDGSKVDFATREIGRTGIQPASQQVVVTLPSERSGDALRLGFSYSGALKQLPEFGTEAATELGYGLDDAINPRRVELASYSSWYPQIAEYGTRLEFDLAVSFPKVWTVVANGEVLERTGSKDQLRTRWHASGALDIVVVASPAFKVTRISEQGYAVEIYSSRLPDAFVTQEAEGIRRTMTIYTSLLGRPGAHRGTVRSVFSPRDAGQGGYAREPMIVTSEGRILAALKASPDLSLLRGIAHEIAHFWWSFGRGQGDWINEAFAEYFSLVAVERIQSREAYNRRIARYREAVSKLPANAPPLADVPASNDGDGYTIRYFKGALLIHAMREAIGDESFWASCRDFYNFNKGGAIGTEEMRTFWSTASGDHVKVFDAWLESPGGLPRAGETPSPK